MDKKEFMLLAAKVAQGTATDDEIRRYNAVFRIYDKQAGKKFGNHVESDVQQNVSAAVGKHIWNRIQEQMEEVSLPPRRLTDQWYFRAAVILIVISIPLWFFFINPGTEQIQESLHVETILPGGNKAVLTLADGRKIALDDATSGNLVDSDGVRVSKSSEGEIIYEIFSTESDLVLSTEHSPIYHQVETPRGGQFQVVLPDGSRVFLNAESSLRYPAVFSKGERAVTLAGEAYFEVAHRPNQPFVVSSNQQHIKVLGTKFNVNSYLDNDQTVTTLMEGSVEVSHENGQTALLRPGEQSIVSNTQGSLKISTVNPLTYMAWKDGLFHFDGEHIRDIMARIARWYDIEISFAEELPDAKFHGVISRFEHVKEVLTILQQTQTVDFEIKGRRIYVMKNDFNKSP